MTDAETDTDAAEQDALRAEVAFDLAAWEATGFRVDTPHGEVWAADLHAVDGGAAGHEPLLLLHGFPSSSYDWHHVLPAWNAERRVVMLDFLGFGLSAKPDMRYSLEKQADAVLAVAEAVGLTEAAMVTHDMGNSIGGEVLARSIDGTLPFAITRRVLTNGSIYIDMAQLTMGQQILLSLPDEAIDRTGDDGTMFKAGMAITFAEGHPPSDYELEAAWQMIARDAGNAVLPRSIRYIEDRRANERRYTGAIEAHPSPLGVVWGRLDPVAIHAMTDTLLEARPGTPRVTLDDVGHWPTLEDPDATAAAVLGFL